MLWNKQFDHISKYQGCIGTCDDTGSSGLSSCSLDYDGTGVSWFYLLFVF